MPIPAKKPVVAAAPPSRLIIDQVIPDLKEPRFTARGCVQQPCPIEAIIICDGHEVLKADLLFRHETTAAWNRLPLQALGNDTFGAAFIPDRLGIWFYTVEAALDHYEGWRAGFFKKLTADEASVVDVQIGLALLARVSSPLVSKTATILTPFTKKKPLPSDEVILRQALDDPALRRELRAQWPVAETVRFERELPLRVDPTRAGFSTWYEFFPRSRWTGIAEQGTLADATARLNYIADMGFDVVYLPPIHPIGELFRKGRNNSLRATPEDPGSPWAIGSRDGGHKDIDQALGNFADFAALIKQAKALKLDVALDIALQCAPDHPYVKAHPEWFRQRPDGSIQYAENPPKKYQDIYPFDFETQAWQALWEELKSIFIFWAEKGVRIFRVDNPHTKAFAFWEWLIREVQRAYPETIFLAEAFTRPHIMAYLAKIGFSQSYTYFTWRENKEELTAYLEELTKSDLKHYFRPNFWPNTPDILSRELQNGGRPMHVQRFILAATLSANYGIYGPAFELMASEPLAPGKEEYLNSEKYERRAWDINQPDSLAPLIRRVNRIRRENPALQTQNGLMFHPVSNERLIAYTKQAGSNLLLIVANLDAAHRQQGILDLQIHKLGLPSEGTYYLHDLLSDAHYVWSGWRNYVALDPYTAPAHIFRISTSRE